jgi:cysteine desulfurase
VARACGARPEGVVFTSGATEANNLAVLGAARARARHGRHVVIGAAEHACVRESALALEREGFEASWLPLAHDGLVDLARAAALLRADTVLVAQLLVHNESGAIHPVRELARLARARAPHAHVHSDAAQALGKLELSLPALGVDSLALSAHKAHGPQGAGALVLAGDVPLAPLTFGGGQERGLRPGTENVAALVGFGLAAELAESERARFCAAAERWRAEFVAGLPQSWRVLEPCARVASILGLVAPGPASEIRRNHLEQRGIVTGAGSACQATKSSLSPSLAALGLASDEIRRFLRVSLSRASVQCDPADVLAALHAVEEQLSKLARSRR